jgi:PDZ domain-containing secreted protein
MTTKQILIIGAIALTVAFAFGRWSAPEKVKTITQTVEKKTDDKVVAVDDHKLTTITETDKPDGTKVKTTVIADTRDTSVHDKSTDQVEKTQSKEVDKSTSKITISMLAGTNVTSPSSLTYGASITKPILGPITVGVFGFQNGTVGASIGLTF